MARTRAIIFDAGGTLIYPADPVGETYSRFAKKYKVKLQGEATNLAFREAFKSCSPRPKDGVPNNGDDRKWWKKVVQLSVGEGTFTDVATFEAFFEEVYLYYGQPDAWGVYPEVMEVLEALRDHDVDLAVLSNWDARLHSVLDGTGIGEFLPRRFISTEIGWEKPDPAIYRHVADLMRLKPETLLSVGDDSRNDVEGPRKAGWKTLQIERPKKDLWTVIRTLGGR